MTIEELKARLRDIAKRQQGSTRDIPTDHDDADNALLAFIEGIDPEVGVLFGKIVRWYE